MADLITKLNLADADHVYTDIIDAHRDLDDEQSHAFNARLVLILANHIGNRDVLRQALELAAKSGETQKT
ncbi:MAG: DUF2783 domain-containing protein [Fimbriimonadaceae bacterium]|nr:DUF2783 domain-containing protein [Alphaproteobacteria bacterium]